MGSASASASASGVGAAVGSVRVGILLRARIVRCGSGFENSFFSNGKYFYFRIWVHITEDAVQEHKGYHLLFTGMDKLSLQLRNSS